MMSSSNGDIFRVTGPLCGELTGTRWIPHKGQWRGTLMFCLICVWTNGWVNNRDAGDLRCHRAHYDILVKDFPVSLNRFSRRGNPWKNMYFVIRIIVYLVHSYWGCTGNICPPTRGLSVNDEAKIYRPQLKHVCIEPSISVERSIFVSRGHLFVERGIFLSCKRCNWL